MPRKKAGLDWEFFLVDPDPGSSPPRVPWRLRLYATARTAKALYLYRQQGWAVAHQYLQELRPGPGSAAYAALLPDAAIRLAWREVFQCQLVARLLVPNALCLPRSFALATYLCALGLPAEVTVARAIAAAVQKNSFHSWTELYGTVLNDNPDVQLGYNVLQRVTSQAREPGATQSSLSSRS